MKVQVVIQPGAEGGYSAFVPGFPGCTSCGDTLEETLANIREAFEGVFEVMQSDNQAPAGSILASVEAYARRVRPEQKAVATSNTRRAYASALAVAQRSNSLKVP
jgi:predicted RNase H-like HicB family nuclease